VTFTSSFHFISPAALLWTSGKAEVQCFRTAGVPGHIQQQERSNTLGMLDDVMFLVLSLCILRLCQEIADTLRSV